jgi:MFS family permease
MMNSFYLIGCVFGSILFGALAFKFGRKKLFFLTLLIYVLSVVVVVFQSDYYLFSLCRFMTGVSVGGEYSAIFAAIDEMIPCRYRGRVDLMIDGSWHLGTMCASLLSVLVYRLDSSSWRGLFLFGAIGVIPLFCLRAMIPESPRWLL